jgi:hypothetical protein
MQAFGRMFEPMMERWSKAYQAEVGGELRKYGLRVDDLLDPDWHPVRCLNQATVRSWLQQDLLACGSACDMHQYFCFWLSAPVGVSSGQSHADKSATDMMLIVANLVTQLEHTNDGRRSRT